MQFLLLLVTFHFGAGPNKVVTVNTPNAAYAFQFNTLEAGQ